MTTKYIKQVKLTNFKRFEALEISLTKDKNVLIGDNGSGKSTLLLAIELVLGGNISRVDNLGIDSLLCNKAVNKFNALAVADRLFKDLPICQIELYFNEQNNFHLNGAFNSKGVTCDGLILELRPRDDITEAIQTIITEEDSVFPFEFYQIIFKTFSGESYTGYSRFMKYLLIDNTQISNEYATKSYVKSVYETHVSADERSKHKFHYRQAKTDFGDTHLSGLNAALSAGHTFELKHGSKSSLDNDLTIAENGVQIEHMGKGQQCFVRVEFALTKGNSNTEPDVILLEEPENHLSHSNMNLLVNKIRESNESQLIITTHNSLVSARLDLKNAILMSSSSNTPLYLNGLTPDTARFFSKAPITNILEFALSTKVILVEGAAEYILLAAFYKNLTGVDISEADVHVISVGGLSFKRYLEVAQSLNLRTAVITDNDGDFQSNILDKYKDFLGIDNIGIFSDKDEALTTFELCLYQDNKKLCDSMFGAKLKTNTVPEYMLANKAEVAIKLLEDKGSELVAPDYIEGAIQWVNE